MINLGETLSQGPHRLYASRLRSILKIITDFWLDSPPKMQTNKEFNFLSTIQASSSLLLQSALAAAERKTKTDNQGDFGQVVFILPGLVLLPESLK